MSDLIERLQSESHEFNFFQAVSLLEEMFAANGIRNPIDTGRIRFESDSDLAFPPNDIANIDESEGAVRFILSFMGLIGVSSPLPIYFSEYISKMPESSKALRDFLSIFNHRMYSLFYKAWKKYHFMRNFSTSVDDSFTRNVACLAGISLSSNDNDSKARLLAYTGILAGSARGPAALKAIISDMFGSIPVRIEQFVPRWAPLRDVMPLGKNTRLGTNTVLGTSVYDLSGKFRVILGPLRRDLYETFLPGTQNISSLKSIVSSYLADPLDYDIQVQLQSMDLIPVVLGQDNTRLGETSSLGDSQGKTSIHAVVIEGYN